MDYENINQDGCNHQLEIFFHDYVQIPIDERQRNDDIVEHFVNQIFAKVRQKDARFVGLMPVGSAFQRLATRFPNEYDFNIVFNKPEDFVRRNHDLFSDKKQRFYDFKRNVEYERSEEKTTDDNINLKDYDIPMCAILTTILMKVLLEYTQQSKLLIPDRSWVEWFITIYLNSTCWLWIVLWLFEYWTPVRRVMSTESLGQRGELSVDPDSITHSKQPLPPPEEGEVYFRLNDTEINQHRWDDWKYKGDLIPFLVKTHFQRLLQEAAKELTLSGNYSIEFESKGSGTAVTCTLSHPELTRNVSIDFSPVLQNIAPLPDPPPLA